MNSSCQQDPLGRLQVQTVFGTNYSNHILIPAFTNTYVYDSNGGDGAYAVYPGLLYKVTDGEGWEKTGYDSRGRTIKTVRHLNINNQNYTNSFTYNDGDRVTSIAYPNSGPTITNSYFTGGSIKQVANNASFSGNNYYTVSAAGYDEFDHVTNFAYGNGLTTTRGYYSVSKRLKTISAGSGGSVFNRTYTYSAGDDILSLAGTGLSGTMTATYDNLHRIKTYSGTSGLSGSYGYDSVGNITNNIEGGGSVYSYANPRKQAVRTAFGYTNLYDLCGNMIVRHGGLTNSQAMVYDADNRLKVFSQAGKVVVEYGYAADGSRLWKRVDQSATNVQVWIGNTYEEKGGKTLFHVFADGQQVCTFETNSYLMGGSDSTKVGYYYHEDNLNSSSALSDHSGNQIEVDSYFPFGRTNTASPQASFQVSRRFTGQVFDGETGLYYYNARYFDPELGRFIQPDTIIPDLSNPQSYNRYSYVLNNPLRYTDPTGHWVLFDKEAWGQMLSPVGQWAHNFFLGGQYPVNNERIMLSKEGIQEFTPLTANGKTLGNPAVEVVKAGGGALLQAGMMLTPAGDEEAAGLAAKELKTVAGKIKGSYLHEFESEMKYVGKGTEKRMATSGKALETANGDVLKGSKFTPSNPNTDAQAFKDEAQKIRDLGGVPNKNLYNKINSPGEKMLPPPIKKEGQ